MNSLEIVKIREDYKLTQSELADLVGVTLRTIQNYEAGNKIPKSKYEMFRKIRTQLSQDSNDDTNIPLRSKDAIHNKNGNTYYEHPNGGFIIQAPLVPFPAYASFIEVYEDEKGYLQFENASFKVDHVGRGKYVAFSTIGDSMNAGGIYDTPHGAEVLGRELSREHWRDGFKPTNYGWIIVSQSGIMHKDIISDMDENGCIKLHSRNPGPEYPDFEIDINTVHSIWKVIKRTF